FRDREGAVGVKARPRLDHRVDIEGVEALAELHQIDRGGVDREVDDHAAARPRGQQRGQDVAIILFRERSMNEPDLPLVEQVPVAVVGRDNHEFRAVESDMPIDPKPIITIGPSKRAWSGPLWVEGVVAFTSVTPKQGMGYAACGTRRLSLLTRPATR